MRRPNCLKTGVLEKTNRANEKRARQKPDALFSG
jgi:hypothetical protein